MGNRPGPTLWALPPCLLRIWFIIQTQQGLGLTRRVPACHQRVPRYTRYPHAHTVGTSHTPGLGLSSLGFQSSPCSASLCSRNNPGTCHGCDPHLREKETTSQRATHQGSHILVRRCLGPSWWLAQHRTSSRWFLCSSRNGQTVAHRRAGDLSGSCDQSNRCHQIPTLLNQLYPT